MAGDSHHWVLSMAETVLSDVCTPPPTFPWIFSPSAPTLPPGFLFFAFRVPFTCPLCLLSSHPRHAPGLLCRRWVRGWPFLTEFDSIHTLHQAPLIPTLIFTVAVEKTKAQRIFMISQPCLHTCILTEGRWESLS